MIIIRKSKSEHGFTLVEVLITMGIICLMGLIILPQLSGFIANRDLKTAARDIAGQIFEAREMAVAKQRWHQIVFNSGAGTYSVQECVDGSLNCANGYSTISTAQIAASNVTMTSLTFGGANILHIQPRGIINPAEAGSYAQPNIILTNARGSTARISVSLTGRASVDWTNTLL
jgi:type IV fimbrial biogenesis protein FimT